LGSGSGIIKAVGTAAQPIIFTSFNDNTPAGGISTSTAGYWHRISLGNDNDEFKYVEVRYATKCFELSSTAFTLNNALIENCGTGILTGILFSGVAKDNIVRNNGVGISIQGTANSAQYTGNKVYSNTTYGVKMVGSIGQEVILSGNEIYDNPTGIYIDAYPDASIANNDIHDNDDYGIFNAGLFFNGIPQPEIPATNNWWGHVSGPFHADDNPAGQGDTINDRILFDPWLGQSALAEEEVAAEQPAAAAGSGGQVSLPTDPQPQILDFSASPERYKEGDNPVKLSWKTENAGLITIEPNIGAVSPEGLWDVELTEPTTFTLTISGTSGEVSQELFVDFAPRDPVVIVPGILGSWGGRLDPIFRTYHGLWNGLKSVGYIENQTLFAFPYDWRNDNRYTSEQFSVKVNEMLRICSCEKIDVIAHSMGGLVTRYYMQNIDSESLDQVIFLGTPHLGSSKAYLAWEGATFGNSPTDFVKSKVLSYWAKLNGYVSTARYIHEQVISIQQLLPTFDYLRDSDSGEIIDYTKCVQNLLPCNKFLEILNIKNLSDFNDIRFYNLVNNRLDTIGEIFVQEHKKLFFEDKNKWIHGKPTQFKFIDGDGTVPTFSANTGSIDFIDIAAEHNKLPYRAQSDISRILIGKEIKDFGLPPVDEIILAAIKSPADIIITDPNGNTFGAGQSNEGFVFYSGSEDPEFITIPNPKDGEYSIQLIGTGTGEYELEVVLLGDDLEVSKIFTGAITPGERHEFAFGHSAEAEEITELEQKDTKAPETEMIIRGEQIGKNEYAAGVSIGFEAKDESRVEKTLYSLDSGKTWQEYSKDLIFNSLGDHEVLYRSIDEHGNEEFARIVTVAVVEKAVMIEERQENVRQSGNDDIIIDSEVDEEGFSTATSIPTTTPTISGEVLGAQTSESDRSRNNFVITIVITLISILILIYLLTKGEQKV